MEVVCHGISLSWNKFVMEVVCHGISLSWNPLASPMKFRAVEAAASTVNLLISALSNVALAKYKIAKHEIRHAGNLQGGLHWNTFVMGKVCHVISLSWDKFVME